MEELIEQLYERFPLLNYLLIAQTISDLPAEALPPVLGFFLAVMQDPPDKPLCFVLPRRGDIARIATVLHALTSFVKKQSQLTHAYGETQFKKGDRIRVHPGRQVYLYGGFDESSRDYIWLETLNGTGRWQLPAANIIPRLEKTTLQRPVGKLNSPIPSPPTAPLDLLLRTSTFGNPSLFQNEVVILDSQSGFEEFADTVVFQPHSSIQSMPTVKELVPLGEISQPASSSESWLTKWDTRNPSGEPLIAVAHSAELLANYCIDSPAFTKVIVVNGLSRLKNRQSYDDMAESQRLVLFAGCDEREMIEALGQAPIPPRFWWISAAEINTGIDIGATTDLTGPVSQLSRWANNQENLNLESLSCDSKELEEVYVQLATLNSQLTKDENDPLAKVTAQAWRALNDTSAVIRPLTPLEQNKFATQIANLRAAITDSTVWLKPETKETLSRITAGLEASLLPAANLGTTKGANLYRLISGEISARRKCALVARNEGQIDELKLWLRQRGLSVEVYSRRNLPADGIFDCLICVSWIGSEALKEVVEALLAPRIAILSYPFEGRWLNQCRRRLQSIPDVPTFAASEKSALLFRSGGTLPCWQNEKVPVPPPPPASQSADIWSFEQRLRAVRKGDGAPVTSGDAVYARYISFIGDTFAFLTDTHKVAVATGLVSARTRQSQKLPERTVLDMEPGDFLVFPESGDRELVQELADKLVGPVATDVRRLARKWKDALQHSGMTPEDFLSQARKLDRPRHPATIRSWFADTLQIGPRDKDDLVLIALVTDNKQLDEAINRVWLAIEKLRSAHLSAGVRLRETLMQKLPQVINQVEENGTQIDLADLGSAWVVQVECIAPEAEQRNRGEVDRLLWERSTSIAGYL